MDDPSDSGIRAPWSQTQRRIPRVLVQPLQSFLATERAGAVLLLAAAVAALVWANSPWSGSYERLWHTELSVSIGPLALSEDLRHWINDALMALFFYVVGLEIKRELVTGELRDRRAAALPIIAAVGGMAVPALVYLAFNAGGAGANGWGIPMATDIAFAVGVLAIVARAAPASLKSFLLTLAIVDDIGAIAVIAIFYTAGLSLAALGMAVLGLGLIAVLQRLEVRWPVVYVVLGLFVWLATFESGVHATISGVALGLMTPAAPFQRPRAVSSEARRLADLTQDDPDPPDADSHSWLYLAALSRETVSPLARAEHLLHPWTSYLVIPIFALANAGVSLSGDALGSALTSPVALGVLAGLVVGKTLGIGFTALAATRVGIARLPAGVTFAHVFGVAALAGIGFTVSLFITGLAFADQELQDAAKVSILLASVLAGTIGAALLTRASRRSRPAVEVPEGSE